MLLSLVQLLAGIGVLLLLVGWYPNTPDTLAIISGIFGAFAWGLVGYGVLNLTSTSGNIGNEPSIAFFAAAGLVITAIPALVDPFDLIGAQEDKDDPFGEL